MSKFQGLLGKGKAGMSGAIEQLKPIGAITAGVIISQKFFDFKTMFKDKKPEDAVIKYEGEIKLGGAAFLLSTVGKNWNPMLKFAIMGVGIQGGIKMVRKYTMNDAGKSFVEQIGQGGYDPEIAAAKDDILKFAANTSNTGVNGPDDEMGRNKSILQNYSTTGVSGPGVELDYAN
jgi:hypothetical protein